MKKLIIFLLALISFGCAVAQTGNDTTKYIYFKNEYGQKFNRIWGTNVVDIPNDTTFSKYGIAKKGANLFVGNGTGWTQVTGGGGAGVGSFNTRTGAVTSLVGDYSAFYYPLNFVHGTAGKYLYFGADGSAFTGYLTHDSVNNRVTVDPNKGLYLTQGASNTLAINASGQSFTNTSTSDVLTLQPSLFQFYDPTTNYSGFSNGQFYSKLASPSPSANVDAGTGGTAAGSAPFKARDGGNVLATPEKGTLEFKNGLWFFTDSISTVVVRDTLAGRAWARSNISGGGGGGAVSSLTTSGTSGAATLTLGVLNIPVYAAGLVDPLTTNGDIIARIAGSTTRLPKGANNTVLLTDGSGNLGYNLLTNANLSGAAAITNANLATMPGHTRKGNVSGSAAVPADITSAQETADLNLFTTSTQGLVPASPGGTVTFLNASGSWLKAYQPSDTAATLATKYYVSTLTDSFTIRNVGASAGFVKIVWPNNGALVSSNLVGAGGTVLTQVADSGTIITTYADPLTTTGDIVAKVAGVTTRLPLGSNGTFLGVSSGVLGYYSPTASFQYTVATAVNTTNYTVSSANYINLPDLTGQANRNFVLPSSPATGQILVNRNLNTSASTFNWLPTNGTVKDATGTTVTTFPNNSVNNLVFDGTNWNVAAIGASIGGSLTTQRVTTGSSGTVAGGNYIYVIDPASTLSSYSAMLPASPVDGQVVSFLFGGTLTSGIVVTSFTTLPNTGQGIIDNTPATAVSVTADNSFKYYWVQANNKWYRFKP